MHHFATTLCAATIAIVVVAGTAFTPSPAEAAKTSGADAAAIKEATATCKTEAKKKKINWPASRKFVSDCVAKIRWLTDNGATGRRNANPQWSPDGSSLVFTDRSSIDDPNPDIWTMRYNGTQRRKISTSANFNYRPTWGR